LASRYVNLGTSNIRLVIPGNIFQNLVQRKQSGHFEDINTLTAMGWLDDSSGKIRYDGADDPGVTTS
jgi:hypothetical protein